MGITVSPAQPTSCPVSGGIKRKPCENGNAFSTQRLAGTLILFPVFNPRIWEDLWALFLNPPETEPKFLKGFFLVLNTLESWDEEGDLSFSSMTFYLWPSWGWWGNGSPSDKGLGQAPGFHRKTLPSCHSLGWSMNDVCWLVLTTLHILLGRHKLQLFAAGCHEKPRARNNIHGGLPEGHVVHLLLQIV